MLLDRVITILLDIANFILLKTIKEQYYSCTKKNVNKLLIKDDDDDNMMISRFVYWFTEIYINYVKKDKQNNALRLYAGPTFSACLNKYIKQYLGGRGEDSTLASDIIEQIKSDEVMSELKKYKFVEEMSKITDFYENE
jgi:hypothetical protein